MKAFAVALLGVFALVAGSAHADDFPSRTIRIIVPFAPGGGADIAGRVVAKKLQENLKQTVVIESRPGATGTLAENFVANSDPDGYTILLATPSSHTIAPHLMKSLPYDALKDLAPVTEFAVVRQLIFVNAAKVPAKSLKELVALAHEKPGTLTYATSGTGSSGHLATESFARMTKMEMRAIPYKGVAPGITAAMTGEVDIMFGPAATALPYVQSGALRPIAAGTDARFPELPDVPTVAEAGWPAYKADAWLGFLVAAKTPKPIIDKLYTEIAKVMNSPDVRTTLDGLSITSMATTPEEFKQMMAKEYEDYGKLIKELGISTN